MAFLLNKDASGEGFDNYLADVQFKKGLYWYYFKMDGVTYEQKSPVAQSGAWRLTKQPQEYPSFEQRREKFCTYDVELQVSYSILPKYRRRFFYYEKRREQHWDCSQIFARQNKEIQVPRSR